MSRKGENIYKRKDGRWEGRYIKARTPQGKAVYGSVYASTYNEVRKKRSQAVADLVTDPLLPDCVLVRSVRCSGRTFPWQRALFMCTRLCSGFRPMVPAIPKPR